MYVCIYIYIYICMYVCIYILKTKQMTAIKLTGNLLDLNNNSLLYVCCLYHYNLTKFKQT